MKSQRGSITLYVSIACLFVLIVGIVAYVGVSNKQAMQIAQLKNIEESYNNKEVTAEELYKEYEGGDIVPVYTPEQFAKVGTGEEVYVAEEGKIYTFSTDKTYMFYGISEDLTDKIKEMLSEQIKEEIKIQIEMEGSEAEQSKVAKANPPELMEKMIAVYWSTDGGATASCLDEGASPIYSKIDSSGNPSSQGTDNPNFKWENWYDYEQGYNFIDTRMSRWANAVTDDGSYWVWIPRFKYQVCSKPETNGDKYAGKINIKFISTDERSGATVNGLTYKTTVNADEEYITQDGEGYIIHPAFEDGSSNGKNNEYANGEWDSELSGFWIAKYEMSQEDANGTAVTTGNTTTGNIGLSSSVKMVSKPNRSSWRNITIGQVYTNCLDYGQTVGNASLGSHLTKNSEWGAVAYLAHSQYGRNGNEIARNVSSSFITGVGTSTSYTYDTKLGMLASTTGNIYGVYDMYGSASERVAVWDTLSTSTNLSNYGASFASSGGVSTKFATAYNNGTSTYYSDATRTICKTGDALKELWITGDKLWFNDTGQFVNNSNPFFRRKRWRLWI